MTFQERIKDYKKRLDTRKKFFLFLEDVQKAGLNEMGYLNIIVYDDFLVIEIETFEQLKKARTFLKKYFGEWKDYIASIDSPYADVAYIRYYRKTENGKYDYRAVEIWYKTTTDNIPEKVKSNSGCKFMEETITRKVFVCPKEETNEKQQTVKEEKENRE